jgi:protocatechuate 4,5-dioxygenase alpha chain
MYTTANSTIREAAMRGRAPGDWGIPGTYVFDLRLSQQGYPLNKMCMSLTKPENREAFKADEEAYISRYPLTDQQKQAVRDRDWRTMVKLGGNLFFLLKLGATVGQGLYAIGAQLRDEPYDQFLATRKAPGAT